MKKSKTQKGITLIALIITIVVLLILVGVVVSNIQNDGILSYAQNVGKDYNQAVKNEQDRLEEYMDYLENGGTGEDILTVATIKNKVLSTTSNTKVYDEYGNKIVVPAGFMIKVDDTTNNADTVTEGIVVEDNEGNQFVWIPVGKIYTDTAKTEANAKTITLGRYTWDEYGTKTLMQPIEGYSYDQEYGLEVGIGSSTWSIIEHQPPVGCNTYGNVCARNINDFIDSVIGTENKEGNGGYYIGRYEARKGYNGCNFVLTTKKADDVYNYVSQGDSSMLSREMYEDGYTSGTFSSDLVNSYAWDTAIVFLETFDDRGEGYIIEEGSASNWIQYISPYSIQTSVNNYSLNKGTEADVVCNIYDMASNCFEFTTETGSDSSMDECLRGGSYDTFVNYSETTSGRYCISHDESGESYTFRPIIYVGL